MTDKATVGFYTLGCKVSQYESEAIAEEFERQGFTVCDSALPCDFYVINTCTVTAEGDRKSRQIIRRLKRNNPEAKVLVCGCYSQRSPDEVFSMPEVDAVIGTEGKMKLPEIARSLKAGERFISVGDLSDKTFEPMSIRSAPRTRVYVKIEDGCESRCAYCAIPSARGAVRSKPREAVIEEIRALCESGVREIVLTGIETGSYGKDFDNEYRLADLICELDRLGFPERIRLGSLAPELVGQDFADKIKGVKRLAPHFHISIQSGSDRVLRLMRRRYTRARLIENINRLREYFPKAQFTTDLMVGFPGESEEDFLESMSIVDEAGLYDAHVFAYSKRHGTDAEGFDGQIDETTKRERSERLIAKVKQRKREVLTRIFEAGEELSCIFETKLKDGSFSGHSDSFIEVEGLPTDLDLRGEIRNCIPFGIKNESLIVDIV